MPIHPVAFYVTSLYGGRYTGDPDHFGVDELEIERRDPPFTQ